jgi:ABC-type uncharacterized transport system substrate-binding protein
VLTNAPRSGTGGTRQELAATRLNVTGNAQLNDLLPPKHVELMKEILPRLKRVGQLVDTTQSNCKVMEEAARQATQRIGATF